MLFHAVHVDTFMSNRSTLSNLELRELQNDYEENFHGDSGSDLVGCFDEENDEFEGMTIMGEEDFFSTYCD